MRPPGSCSARDVRPGRCSRASPERVDGEYTRQGTAAICLLCEPLAGQRQVFVRAQRRRPDFAAVIKTLGDELHPAAQKIVLVLDQLNPHGVASLYAAYGAGGGAPPGRAPGNPPHAQTRLLAEPGRDRNLRVRARPGLQERRDNQEHLARAVAAWQHARNHATCKLDWRFTTADARIKRKRLYPVILP